MAKVYCNNCDKQITPVEGKCPKCGFDFTLKIHKTKKTKFKEKVDEFVNSPKVFTYIIIGVIGIIAVVGIVWFARTMSDINKESEEINQEINTKNKACELMTDAYNKCSYSYSEKRCICKRR